MPENKIEIIIYAKDLASGVINAATGATRSYRQVLQETNGAASEFSGTIRSVFLAFGGYNVIHNAITAGFKFNSIIEETKVGLASLIYSMREFQDASGNVVTGQQAFDAALGISKEVQDRLRIAGLETAATYEQLTKAYTQSYVPAIKAGFDENQITNFSTAVVQAATAMRVPLDLLGEEVRSILRGVMTPRTTILQPLMEAAGMTNEKIRQLNAEGKLYPAVMKALEGATVGAAEASKNFSVRLSNLKDAVTQALGKGLEAGFEKTKSLIDDATAKIVTFNKKTGEIKWNENLVVSMQKLDKSIFSVVDGIREASKAITEFTNEHPVITDLAEGIGVIALKAFAVIVALRAMGGMVTWLASHWKANIAFITGLMTKGIGFIENLIVTAVTGLSGVATAAAVAAVAIAAIAAAFVGWQIGKQIAQMEILGITIGEAMQAGYASIGKFFAYTVYAWDMIGATAKAVWGQVKEAGKILFYEFIATIQESFPKMAAFFGLTDDYRKKADAARSSQTALYKEFTSAQTAALDKRNKEIAFQSSIQESIFREADARNKVKAATDSAAKSAKDLSANTKDGAAAAMEYVLKHRDVNQVLDRMTDHLTSGAEKIRELQLEIRKLAGSKIGAEYIDNESRYNKEIASAQKHYDDMVRIQREFQEKLKKAHEDAAKKNKENPKEGTKYGIDPQINKDLNAINQAVFDAENQKNEIIRLARERRLAADKVVDRSVLTQKAADSEAEISQRLAVLDILEKEGKAHQETVEARIALMEKQKSIQEALLKGMVKEQDITAWNSQKDRIIATNKALAELYRDSMMKTPFGAIKLAMSDMVNQWKDRGKQMYDVATQTAQAMQQGFSDLFFDAFQGKMKSLGDYINAFLALVQRAIANALSQQVSAGIASGVKWLFSSSISQSPGFAISGSPTGYHAHGNIFDSGRLVPFASGAVVYRPTIFPMASGMGLMGEAGPEAIMPLTRLANGDLGVQAAGGGSAQPNVEVQIIVNNKTGIPVKQTEVSSQWDGKRMIKNVMLELAGTDNTIKRAYGVRGV